jgi:hypothetical protein
MDKLPLHFQKKVLTVYRWVTSKDEVLPDCAKDLTWVPKNIDIIEAKIDTYPNLNTRKSYNVWLTTVFRNLGETELHEKYKKIICKQQQAVNDEEMNNTLSAREKRKYRTWPEIMESSNKIAAAYSALHNPTLSQHIHYLVCQMYTRMPPLRRTPLLDARILGSQTEAEAYNGNSVFPRSEGGFAICAKYDKVKRFYNSTIIKCSKRVSEILENSFKTFPREYLFDIQGNGMHMSIGTMDNILNELGTNIDNLRSAYITAHFGNNVSLKKQKQICLRMRTGFQNAVMCYKKTSGSIEERDLGECDD